MDCFSIFSSILGGKGGGCSCDASGAEGECCCVKCLRMIKDEFNFNVTENDKGISINISPKDPNKVEALKSLLRGIKGLCGVCCTEEKVGKTEKECCP